MMLEVSNEQGADAAKRAPKRFLSSVEEQAKELSSQWSSDPEFDVEVWSPETLQQSQKPEEPPSEGDLT